MSDSLATTGTVPLQAPLSMGFPRQEYRSGLSFHSPGHLPHPGVEPASPALQVDSLLLSHQGSPFSDGESEVTKSCPTLCYPMAMAQGFSRQEYWSVLPFLMVTVCNSLKEKKILCMFETYFHYLLAF